MADFSATGKSGRKILAINRSGSAKLEALIASENPVKIVILEAKSKTTPTTNTPSAKPKIAPKRRLKVFKKGIMEAILNSLSINQKTTPVNFETTIIITTNAENWDTPAKSRNLKKLANFS